MHQIHEIQAKAGAVVAIVAAGVLVARGLAGVLGRFVRHFVKGVHAVVDKVSDAVVDKVSDAVVERASDAGVAKASGAVEEAATARSKMSSVA